MNKPITAAVEMIAFAKPTGANVDYKSILRLSTIALVTLRHAWLRGKSGNA